MSCKLLGPFGFIVGLATVLAFVTLAAGPVVAQGQAATFRVTKTADTADGSCDSDCSLREAIIAANAEPDRDTVTVPAGRYEPTLGNGNDPEWRDTEANGDLDIRAAVSIRGAGAPSTIVVGAWDEVWEPAEARVFHSSAPRNTSFAASISGLTVTGGLDGGIDNARRVALRLTQVAVQRNHFSRSGF